MAFETEVKVRFSDVDNAGIVYYPRFFHFFHIGFEEMFTERFHQPYPDVIAKEKLGFPAVHAEVDFKAPLRFGDVAIVAIEVERVGTKSVGCRYTLRRKSGGEVCAVGKVTVATVDMATFQPIAVPAKYRNLFSQV
jgi:4-hydroxybenzoyl-CoA thioesterase